MRSRWLRTLAWLGTGALAVAGLGGCGDDGPSGGQGRVTLNWYANPDNGGQAALAAKCSKSSDGAYRIKVSVLPNDATGQREQLVRRLAAEDSSIDIMSIDPPFVAEFATAGFLRELKGADAAGLTDGVLDGAVAAYTWDGKLMAAPFWANSQLLWYRRSVAEAAGLDPAAAPVTWAEIIDAAEVEGKTVAATGNAYEGYMVWISALVSSAGGEVLRHPEEGKEAEPGLDSPAGRKAAEIIGDLARSGAADAGLSTADEEGARAAFQGQRGGFMLNWPYVYGAAQEAVAAGSLDQSVVDDIGWARYPQVVAGRKSRPPLGGIGLAVGAYSDHQRQAVDAVRCATTAASQKEYMLSAKNPAARSAVYDDAEVRKAFPMADLIRESIGAAAPRPQTPYYTDVSAAVVRTFHPPGNVRAARTPKAADRLVVDVLHDKALL